MPFEISYCPFCKEEMDFDKSNLLYCSNKSCPEKQQQLIYQFFKENPVEELTFGKEGTIKLLYDKGYKTLQSFFNILLIDLLNIENFDREKSLKLLTKLDNLKLITGI